MKYFVYGCVGLCDEEFLGSFDSRQSAFRFATKEINRKNYVLAFVVGIDTYHAIDGLAFSKAVSVHAGIWAKNAGQLRWRQLFH